MTARQYFAKQFKAAIPQKPIASVVAWAEEFVRLPGSAKSERFDSSITPWTRVVIECCDDGVTQSFTFVKPIQGGGSVAGEIALCRWLATKNHGDIQYNWQTDDKADERFIKRMEKILQACGPVMKRAPRNPDKWLKGLIIFPHANFIMQGIKTAKNVASDSICYQINEELHDTKDWTPGRVQQAHARTTAFWNHVIGNISNAGHKGSELEGLLLDGTNEAWEVLCPGCGLYHIMRNDYDEKEPHLGGIRYDSEACKISEGHYDYNKMQSSIRLQMPCGYPLRDDMELRKKLSITGRYSSPRNQGAHISNRSFTLEACSIDYIPFISLIQEKHKALKALRHGEPLLYEAYLRERSCRFWDPKKVLYSGEIVLQRLIVKNREGLKKNPDFFGRFFAIDRQQGTKEKNELPHWWMVIRDVLNNGDSLLVYEGKIESDMNVVEVLEQHECIRLNRFKEYSVNIDCYGVADSGWDSINVYRLCYRYGFNAIKGASKSDLFRHESKDENGEIVVTHRIFEQGNKLVFQMLGIMKPRYSFIDGEPDPDEPRFFQYSKNGIRDRLNWLRSGVVRWDVPSDVSQDYQEHMESEKLRDGKWVKRAEHARNDLFVCEAYIALQMEQQGVIGLGAIENGEQKETE